MEKATEAILASMGYSSYENYRSRALWKKIKERVLARDNHTCMRCNGRGDVVHHRSYTEAVLKGEADDQLVSLCGGCHEVVHFNDAGRARSEQEVDRVLHEPDLRTAYPKVDMRRTSHPPEWKRMNARQREGWSNEFHFRKLINLYPDLAEKQPARYACAKERYEATRPKNTKSEPRRR